MVGPLHGITVLEFSQIVAAPYAGACLADLGADVIKIEPPGGDQARLIGGAPPLDSKIFQSLNRGKRGIVLDLKTPAAQTAFRRLARRSDVLIENYRPGVMQTFGLDYPTLSADNPGLVYASISGYGRSGPDAARGGFDLVAQGVAGIMSVTGEPGGAPMKAGLPLTDLGAGLFALSAILAALYYRTRTGHGQHVDTSLLDAGVALSVWEATEYFATGRVPEPMGSAHRMSAPYQAVRCADGYITLAAANDRLFVRLCGILGHPEWATDPAYANDTGRVRNRKVLARMIESVTIGHSRQHWLDLLEANEIPCGPINRYDEVFTDRQVLARSMVVETDHPRLGRIRTLGSPVKMSETPPIVGRRAPLLGEHTEEVLRQAGCDEQLIAALLEG